jgi:hypothetical protein
VLEPCMVSNFIPETFSVFSFCISVSLVIRTTVC